LTTPLLELCADLPVVEIPAGHTLLEEGGRSSTLYLLIEGTLEIRKDGVRINTIDRPGASLGEVSLLLGVDHSATVVTLTPCRLHVIDDGPEALRADPELLFAIAGILADRLRLVTTFLADLRRQYGDAEGNLAMVDSVLDALTRHTPTADPGSEREPDPRY
jgi:CRP/FNR family transcriptional regulator, cyclic AMP receptor protein